MAMVINEHQHLENIYRGLPAARRVIAFAPHPDDEVFGCGGTLCLLQMQGSVLTIVIVTDGAGGGANQDGRLPVIRAEESRAAARVLGFPEPLFWDYPDRELTYGEELIERIQAAIAATEADLVLLPSPTELHPDHQILAFAGIEALRRCADGRKAAFYEINLPLPSPNLFVDISPVMDRKRLAMGCFPSQLQEQPYALRIEGLNRFRSYFLGVAVVAAEALLLVESDALKAGCPAVFEGPLAHRHNLGYPVSGADIPLTSVVIRSMDRPTLQRAIDSLQVQTWPNIEIVVVNAKGGLHGGLEPHAGRFPLRLLNQGGEPLPRSRAANVGIGACLGKYVCLLDDDDTLDADHLYHLATAAQSATTPCAVYSGVRVVDECAPGKPLTTFAEPEISFARLLLGNALPIHAALFPAALAGQGILFDEELDLYEDWDFWLQVSRQLPFHFVNRVSATYYTGGASTVGAGTGQDTTHQDQAARTIMAKWRQELLPQELLAMGRVFHQGREQLFQGQEYLTGQLRDQDRQIKDQDQQIKDQDRQIKDRDRQIKDRDRQIKDQDQQIKDQDRQISSIDGALQQALKDIEAIYASRSWQYSAPLRWSGRHARRLRQLARALPLAFQHAGSVERTLQKGWSVYRREGIAGVISRFRMVLAKEAWLHCGDRAVNPCQMPVSPAALQELSSHQQPVDILICVHNALDDVKRCIDSVLSATLPPYRLIIVDDGSKEETRHYLEQLLVGQQATLIRHDTAKGYTLAANAGLRASTAPFVVLLNSDTIVPSRWLDRLVRCAQSDPRIGMVGPLSNTASWQSVPAIFEADGDWSENPLPPGWDLESYAIEVARESVCMYPRVGFLNGFCLLIKRELLDEIGIFDEETFGRGYGEENDYCLRATGNQWQLAVADDCYVFHAQSKSYSSERRKELSGIADKALENKHGLATVLGSVLTTSQLLALEYIRKRCEHIPLLAETRRQVLKQHEGKRVLYILPAKTPGGGANIVLQECSAMRRLGIDAWIVNMGVHRELFESCHPGLDVPVRYIEGPEGLLVLAQEFDAIIATLYLTAFWLKPVAELPYPPRLGYYIQDFEPDFFEEGTLEYQEAFDSYTAVPGMRLFTKTAWNRDVLLQKTGQKATVIGPSMNLHDHFPAISYRQNNQIHIVAMVRPSTPRRAPELTMRVLKKLKERFQQQVSITIFGVNPDDPSFLALERDFAFDCRGELYRETIRALFAATDIFVDCSSFQAMGLTAMEAMASGVAVVGPQHGGLGEIVQHGQNGILVDTGDEQAIIEAVARLVEQAELRRTIQTAAIAVIRHSPLISAARTLDLLFGADGGTL